MQHPDLWAHIEDSAKEEGECTDEDEPDISPLVDAYTDEAQTKECPPDPWNDSAFTLQERLNQIRWESLEPEPNYELYGVSRDEEKRQAILLQVGRIHRCVDQMKTMVQSMCTSQGLVKGTLKVILAERAEELLKVNQINRSVKYITHTVNEVSESQDSTKNILKDLYDIINDMNRDRNEPQDFELLQKINGIINRMTQINLGQESVKEVMTKLKGSLKGNSRSKKRGYYQIMDCDTPHYEEKTKQPRLSSEFCIPEHTIW